MPTAAVSLDHALHHSSLTAGLDVSAEAWTPKPPDSARLFAPGQRYGDARYHERFAGWHAQMYGPYTGLTVDGSTHRGLFRLESTGQSTREIRQAALAFLDSLTPAQREQATFPIDAQEWRLWHGLFTRLLRHGVGVEEMTSGQQQRMLDLLQASLSARGFAAVQAIRQTNQLAGELTGLFRDLGADIYWLSIFGTPSEDEPWGWQIDGHHVNISYFVLGDQVVMTPTFLGAEPTNVRTGPLAGLRVFQAEESDALTLIRSLDDAQRAKAVVEMRVEVDMFTGFFRDNLEVGIHGIPGRELSGQQRDLLVRVLDDYVGYMRDGHASVRMVELTRFVDETHFAWMGPVNDTDPFYYRIQSPVILIEFSHILGVAMTGGPSRNHVHTVVRTPNGNDYGKDLLRLHVERAHR